MKATLCCITLTLALTLNLRTITKAADFSVCKNEVKKEEGATDETVKAETSQRDAYCKAAKASSKAADANKTLVGVWSAVAAVCITACGASAMGSTIISAGSDSWICLGSNIAAGASEGLITKKFMDSVTGLAMSAVPVALKLYSDKDKATAQRTPSASESASQAAPTPDLAAPPAAPAEAPDLAAPPAAPAEAPAPPAPPAESASPAPAEAAPDPASAVATENEKVDTDWSACLSAAMAAGKAVWKYTDYQRESKNVDKNLKNAKKLLAKNLAIDTDLNTKGSSSGTYDPGSIDFSAPQAATPPASTAATDEEKDLGEEISYAMTNDPLLPKFIQDPKFKKEFENTANTPLQDFIFPENGEPLDPANSIPLAANGGKSVAATDALSDQLNNLKQELGHEVEGAIYYSGGGSGNYKGGDSGSLDFAKQIGGLMDQFIKKPKKEENKPGSLNYGKKDRKPASIWGDKQTSIFERVSGRYINVSRKWVY